MTVYLNGKYLPDDQALVPVLDRGFVFGDGVYEVIPAYWGKPFRVDQHLERLNNSLTAIRMSNPLPTAAWHALFDALLRFNPPSDNLSLYLQVTRGPAKRDHAIPAETRPTVFAMCTPIAPLDPVLLERGVSLITLDDIRWKFCRIKAITLLPNVLLRAEASDADATDALLIRDGEVTEGTASNVFIVKHGKLLTPPKGDFLLPGITRDLVLEIAQRHHIPNAEQRLTERDLTSADEIWLTSSTKEILPVTQLNGRAVGSGKPGPLWRNLLTLYQQYKDTLRTV